MNVIIYSEDFEPITLVDLPLSVLESAETKGGIMIALKRGPDDNPPLIKVDCHKISWIDGSTKTILVTKDEEHALLLKPAWIVGQKAIINAYERTIDILTTKVKNMNKDN